MRRWVVVPGQPSGCLDPWMFFNWYCIIIYIYIWIIIVFDYDLFSVIICSWETSWILGRSWDMFRNCISFWGFGPSTKKHQILVLKVIQTLYNDWFHGRSKWESWWTRYHHKHTHTYMYIYMSTRWHPLVIGWFMIPINYRYNPHKP